MLFYLLEIEEDRDTAKHGLSELPLHDGETLAVFTSPQSLSRAMKAQASLPKVRHAGFSITDPFDLAVLVDRYERSGLKYLMFDPTPTSDGLLQASGDPIPTSDYFDSIHGLLGKLEKLDAKGEERFFQASHLNKEPFVRWPNASADDIAADLLARIDEWTECEE